MKIKIFFDKDLCEEMLQKTTKTRQLSCGVLFIGVIPKIYLKGEFTENDARIISEMS